MINKHQYWFELADYDIETALAMFNSKRYLYVGFMCHLATEKTLKGCYEKTLNEIPPYSHNLRYLSDLSKIYESMSEEQKLLIEELQPLNIQARYPSYKDKIFKSLNELYCKELISKTKELILWIKSQV